MPASAYDELAEELRELVAEVAADTSEPPSVWTVIKAAPLIIEGEDEDDRLEEGDEDFDISAAVRDAEPQAGDAVIVIRDDGGDYVAVAALGTGGALGRHAAKHKGVHGLPAVPTDARGVVWNEATQQWDVAPAWATVADRDATNARVTALEVATGQEIDFRKIDGSQEAYSSNFTTTQSVLSNGTANMQLSYTPPVNVWWEVNGHIGIVQKMDAAYHYIYGGLTLTPADADGLSLAYQLVTQHNGVNLFEGRVMRRRFKLAAGTPYTVQLGLVGPSGGTWSHYRGKAQLWLGAMAITR